MGINPPPPAQKREVLAKAKATGLVREPVKLQPHFEQFKKQKKAKKR
jgi:hypothetical protein